MMFAASATKSSHPPEIMLTRSNSPHNRFVFGASAFGVAVLIIAVLFCACLVSGCSSLPSFARPVVPVTQTNTVVLTLTNTVPEIRWQTNTVAVTNLVAGERVVITNVLDRTPIVVTNLEVRVWTNITVVTNGYAVNQDFTAAVETARRANSALNPTPTAPLVDWGLTLFGLAASGIAAWKNRQHKQAEGKLSAQQVAIETVEDINTTLIKSIETAPPVIVGQLKKHVASIAALRDIGPELDAAVQKVTAAMADGHMTAEEFNDLAQDPAVTEDMIPPAMRAAFRKLRA
jgi:hypothetical protein